MDILLGKLQSNLNLLCLIKLSYLSILLADELIELIQSRRGQDSAYIGCMKSGEVVAEE